jgi:hypothetical protein
MNDLNEADREVKIGFDESGPRLGSVRLLNKTSGGFAARSAEDLSALFDHMPRTAVDIPRLLRQLESIARWMNGNELGLAAIASGRLASLGIHEKHLAALAEADRLLKASVDDPKHPGYPKDAPDSEGGQFRPLDESGDTGGALRPPPPRKTGSGRSKAVRLDQLARRRGLRAAIKNVLTGKRIARLLGENSVAAVAEAVPGVDVAADALALSDDLAAVSDILAYKADTDAAIAFVEKGPLDLAQLRVADTDRSFSSYSAFTKADLEKYFGRAGDGEDYHHIVEQSARSSEITDAMLQSTSNIVKIPRLLHEEINAIYATPRLLGGVNITPRDYLRGKSYQERYELGLTILREVGALK